MLGLERKKQIPRCARDDMLFAFLQDFEGWRCSSVRRYQIFERIALWRRARVQRLVFANVLQLSFAA